jgi:mercuric ion transport protein
MKRQTLGAIGALVTCPCHWIGIAVLLGGTAATAWLARYLPALLVVFGVPFLISLWFLFRREPSGACERCAPGARGGVGG